MQIDVDNRGKGKTTSLIMDAYNEVMDKKAVGLDFGEEVYVDEL